MRTTNSLESRSTLMRGKQELEEFEIEEFETETKFTKEFQYSNTQSMYATNTMSTMSMFNSANNFTSTSRNTEKVFQTSTEPSTKFEFETTTLQNIREKSSVRMIEIYLCLF